MMPGVTDHNLVAYAVQLAALIGAVSGLLWLFGIAEPRTRLTVLRLTLGACVLLPFVQGVDRAPVAVRAPGVDASATSAAAPAFPLTAAPSRDTRPRVGRLDLDGLLLVMAGAGIAARLAWLSVGLAGLRRLRRRSAPLVPTPPQVRWASEAVAADASFRTADGLGQPVSFGVRHPVVIVPASFVDLDEDAQRAVAAHELVHVRERHWRHVLIEEIGRAALWFHPAVWWLIDQIHLAREQLVDGEVVRLTGRRRAYLDLLLRLSSADASPAPALASGFFRRGHLKRRIALLLKEASMSTLRRSLSLAAVTLLVCATAAVTTKALPLHARPERVSAQPPAASPLGVTARAKSTGFTGRVTVAGPQETTTPNVLHKVLPVYPQEAASANVSGPVVLEVTCDTSGVPVQVQPIAGAAELTTAAVDAVTQWRFEPPAQPVTFVVGINVLPPGSQDAIGEKTSRIGRDATPPKKIVDVRPQYPPEAKDAGVQGIVIAEVTIGANGLVQDARVLRSVKGLEAAALSAVLQWQYTQTVVDGRAVPVIMTVTVNFRLA